MNEAITLGITVDRPWLSLYEMFWRPEAFPSWASGLSQAELVEQEGRWLAKGPGGSVLIRFTDHNPYGVMDHWVELASGDVVYVPLRVIANGPGAEVQLTLFRQAGMDEAAFERDADWVRQDLLALKRLAETSISPG